MSDANTKTMDAKTINSGMIPTFKTLSSAPGRVSSGADEFSEAAPAPAKNAIQANSNGVKPNTKQQPASGESAPLRGQIEQKYISRLQSLASGYEGELNRLISAALSE